MTNGAKKIYPASLFLDDTLLRDNLQCDSIVIVQNTSPPRAGVNGKDKVLRQLPGKNGAGFTLIEILFYISIISFSALLFVNIFLSFSNSYSRLKVEKKLDDSAITSIGRIIYEIRNSTGVDMARSVFGSDSGVLVLNQLDSSNNAITREFFINNSKIYIDGSDIDSQLLLPGNVIATKMSFALANSGKSKAVKVEIAVAAKDNISTTTKFYPGFAVVRGSY